MLRLMLNQHPSLMVPFESGFITEYYRRLDAYGPLTEPTNKCRLLDDISAYHLVKKGGHTRNRQAILNKRITSYAELVDAIFSTLAEEKHKRRWGDKTPDYVVDLEVLWALFPGCKIIHVVRDGRDVALSLRDLSWGTRSLPRAAADWRWKAMIGRKVGAVLGTHYIEVRYEDLVRNPELQLLRVCEFLDEPYDAAMLSYYQSQHSEMPPDSLAFHRNSVKPPDPALVFGWKRRMSVADRTIFEQIAGDALDLFVYQRENLPSSLRSRLKNLYYSTVERW
jgi:hypothetical protein